jgi:hypothetical protein
MRVTVSLQTDADDDRHVASRRRPCGIAAFYEPDSTAALQQLNNKRKQTTTKLIS